MQPPDPFRRFLAPLGLTRLTQDIDILSLWRWVRLSVLVGVLVGTAAALAYVVLEWSEALLLFRIAGHEVPAFGEHLFSRDGGGRIWWLILLLPAAGGLVAGLLVHHFAQGGAEQQGINVVVDSFHQRRGVLKMRETLARFVGSIFTLGTGGSAGREGPLAHLGASCGSLLARRLKLSDRDRRLLLMAGAAGGIAAMFRAPLGAAIWSLEVLYRNDFEAEGMFPCLVSSVTAYSVFTAIFGQGSLLSVPHGYEFAPSLLLFYALTGVACATFGLIWVQALHLSDRHVRALKVPAWLRPALGGLALGAFALAVPWILGSGYGWIQDALRAPDAPERLLPGGFEGFWLLLALALAKIVATVLTVGSGGSGGVFAPSLFIGGFVGGACGLLFHEIAPGVVTQPGAFVLVGMGAFYAGIAAVPLSTIILISELFGSYDLLVPLMLAVMITVVLLRNVSLHTAQVATKLESPAHVDEFVVDVLEHMKVDDHYARGRASAPVRADMPLSDFLEHVSATAESFFVVQNTEGKIVGVVSLEHVRSVVAEQEFLDFVVVGDAMTGLRSVSPEDSLQIAVQRLIESRHEFLAVIDPARPDEVLGSLSQRQVSAEYHAEILRRRLGTQGSEETEQE